MKPSLWLSATSGVVRQSPGAFLRAALGLLGGLALLAALQPTVQRWASREAAIAAARERLSHLNALTEHREDIARQRQAWDSVLAAGGIRVLRSRTPALAASELQEWLGVEARASRLLVNRLDAAGTPTSYREGVLALPATVSATGDIYGLADFLRRLYYGSWLIEIAELSVAPNPTMRGELLQITLTLRAPFLVEERP
jgi:hypothetical protein